MKEADFRKFVADTKKVVLGSIARSLYPENHDAIDDIVQEVYLRAYQSLSRKQFRNEASMESWLYTIARNEALRCNKKRGSEKTDQVDILHEVFQEIPDGRSENPDDNGHAIDLVYKKIAELPEKYRNVMELDIMGLKERQIAERLEISLGTVKSRLSRAREKLRQMLYSYGITSINEG